MTKIFHTNGWRIYTWQHQQMEAQSLELPCFGLGSAAGDWWAELGVGGVNKTWLQGRGATMTRPNDPFKNLLTKGSKNGVGGLASNVRSASLLSTRSCPLCLSCCIDAQKSRYEVAMSWSGWTNNTARRTDFVPMSRRHPIWCPSIFFALHSLDSSDLNNHSLSECAMSCQIKSVWDV